MTLQRKPWSVRYRSSAASDAPKTIHDVFTDRVRRTLVSALLAERVLGVDELAEIVAEHDHGPGHPPSDAWILHEHVLPMVDAELVTFDAEAGTVALAPGVTFTLPPQDESSLHSR